MAIPVIPSRSPTNNVVYIRTLMIDYAYSNYKYVMTPKEAEEILTKPYWDDVDAFCSYSTYHQESPLLPLSGSLRGQKFLTDYYRMIQASFGQPVSSTSNVKLPSTINIYTDEELNAMESGLVELLPPRNAELNVSEESSAENERPTMSDNQENLVRSISQTATRINEGDLEIESEFEGEYLPRYTPEILPAYTPFGVTEIMSEDPLISTEEARETNNTEDVPIYGTNERHYDETRAQDASRLGILYTLRSRMNRKFQSAKQKLACSFKIVSAKKALKLTLAIKKEYQGR
ncbi:hypothetical protein F5Y00DRAFT_274016 [Daldinia vernicosa]|uniref:uncharacterized protein n=1 Tax=Daldinia vernicosa TaxID=114800 RepID=UPI0020077E29|nr:uncharacterized protein F5Y00DRAFT_274016 [Daldinia vernicosa]KAI0844477.1 hypothetical protein F5Y00DRAFT_274016 [Daldinia vernicosa]